MIPPTTAPGQPVALARYLHGKLITVIATGYGGYAVTSAVSQSSLWMTVSPTCPPEPHILPDEDDLYGIVRAMTGPLRAAHWRRRMSPGDAVAPEARSAAQEADRDASAPVIPRTKPGIVAAFLPAPGDGVLMNAAGSLVAGARLLAPRKWPSDVPSLLPGQLPWMRRHRGGGRDRTRRVPGAKSRTLPASLVRAVRERAGPAPA